MEKEVIVKMRGQQHVTVKGALIPLPIDIENKTGQSLEVEVHTYLAGRIGIIIRNGE